MQESYKVHIDKNIYHKCNNISDVIREVKKNGNKIGYILHYLDNEIIGIVDIDVIKARLKKR